LFFNLRGREPSKFTRRASLTVAENRGIIDPRNRRATNNGDLEEWAKRKSLQREQRQLNLTPQARKKPIG
jgi:hypothetical protein